MTQEYPTEEKIKEIETLDYKDFHAFMEVIHKEWAFEGWGWKREGEIYYISTGGWSGNEDLIEAMVKNTMFWIMYWQETRRGGHYIFAPLNLDNIEILAHEIKSGRPTIKELISRLDYYFAFGCFLAGMLGAWFACWMK